jgi:hypothetical protein
LGSAAQFPGRHPAMRCRPPVASQHVNALMAPLGTVPQSRAGSYERTITYMRRFAQRFYLIERPGGGPAKTQCVCHEAGSSDGGRRLSSAPVLAQETPIPVSGMRLEQP